MMTAEQEATTSNDLDFTSPNIKPTYSRFRMSVIQITPESMKCKLYCRGTHCKYCTSTGWADSEQAIRGIYSSWITAELLAMARPTQNAIVQYDIIQQFKNENVKTVINLQTAHEHAFCGPPLHISGFSYDPELLMQHKTDLTISSCEGPFVRSKAIQSPKQILIIQQFSYLINKFANDEQARKYCHIPKVIYIICDVLLQQIFEDGIKYSILESEKHNVRACTMGKLSVEWKYAFTAKGKARTRYIVNLFARISAFPFEKDIDLEYKFKHLSVVNLEQKLMELEPKELIYILNCFMESPHRPYCSKKEMVKTLKKYAPLEQETTENNDSANHLSVPSENASSNPTTNPDVNSIFVVKCGASWQCMIFFMCNVLSYLMGENYDIVVELITVWLLNEMDEEVKSAVHGHMRDLFARNLREQEQQSRLLRAKQNKS